MCYVRRGMFPDDGVSDASYRPPASDFALGYAMGLIVGEGSFTGDRRRPCLSVRLHVDNPRPLNHLKLLFGGRLYGPYQYDGRVSFVWLLRGDDLWDALPTFFERLPESRKRRQFERWAVRWGFTSRMPGRLFGAKETLGS